MTWENGNWESVPIGSGIEVPTEVSSPSEEDRIVERMDSNRRVGRLITNDEVVTDFVRKQGGSRSDAARYLFGD